MQQAIIQKSYYGKYVNFLKWRTNKEQDEQSKVILHTQTILFLSVTPSYNGKFKSKFLKVSRQFLLSYAKWRHRELPRIAENRGYIGFVSSKKNVRIALICFKRCWGSKDFIALNEILYPTIMQLKMIPDQNFHGNVFANTIIKSVKKLGSIL